MENYRQLSTSQLAELVFDDEETAKVGAALRALADQITSGPRSASYSAKIQNDVIEVLSDSDEEAGLVIPKKRKERKNTKEMHSASEAVSLDGVEVSKINTSHFDLYNPYDSDTMSAWTESESSPLKFEYEPLEESGNQETSADSNQPQLNSASFMTITSLTGDGVQLEQLHSQQLSNEVQEQKVEAKLENGVQSIVDCVNKHELETHLTKHEIEIEEPLMQTYLKKECKPLTHEDQSSYSQDDSNGFSAVFGTDEVNTYGAFSFDDTCEMPDLRIKQTLVDLADSETEDDMEQWNGSSSKPTYNGQTLRSVARIASIDRFTIYTCPECGVLCDSFNDWKLHTDDEHKFNTIGALNMQTIASEDGNLSYQCRDCDQKFELHKGFRKLLPHRFKHLPNEDYLTCRICQSSFRCRSSMRSHLANVHHTIWREYLQQQEPPKLNASKFIKICCPICNKPLASRKKWQEHLELVHDYSANIMSQMTLLSENIYHCSVCNSKMRKRSIMDHMLTHEKYKSFACTLCAEYRAVGFMLALTHVRRTHLMSDKELLLKCYYCDDTFKSTTLRKNHLRKAHKYKMQKCAICKKEFYTISLLVSHMNFANHHKLK